MHRGLVWTVLALALTRPAIADRADLWNRVDPTTILPLGPRDITPSAIRTFQLDTSRMGERLAQAPRTGREEAPTILALPLPDGSFGRFQIEEAPIMAPELAARYPRFKTYRGQGLDDPTATLRLDFMPQGLHALILTSSGSIWIDPFQRGDSTHYLVYRGREARRTEPFDFTCGVTGGSAPTNLLPNQGEKSTLGGLPSNGGTLRDYRIAVAATAEYTAFHSAGSPTVAEGLAAIVTAMNRINGLFERSLSMTLTLVADNDQIVYTNSATDPYSNGDNVSMMFENESNLNAVIGSANFDVGHVFGTGGGGVAIRLVPCSAEKARGASSASSPVGDAFWIRVVAHEIGHQFGANHTFNGDEGACFGTQRNPDTAFEPGSGSTILSYAGLCGSQNLQSSSDAYFHGISLEEMSDFVNTGGGASCPTESATGNGIPTVDAGSPHTLPLNTPFELCGSASDPDRHPLTFQWEQFDAGPAGAPGSPSGNAPIFRSWTPTSSPCRTFPRLEDLLAGTSVIGEVLPSYARTITFRLTASDQRAEGGAFATDSVNLEVTDQAGPFLLTSPNSGTWMSGQEESVTWDVAGTDLAPVNCSAVHILLSTDGGLSYAHTLAMATPNDGEQTVVVPLEASSETRVKVACSDNIFFDVSDNDLEVIFSPEIFADGFESGTTALWSSSVP